MSEAAATVNFSAQTTELGDRIAELTLKQAKELSEYLEQKYGIKAAAAGAVMMAGPSPGEAAAAPAAKTEFDVVLTGFGDKKLNVVKVVKAMTGASLMDAKKLVESAPATIKQAVPKEEAEKLKKELEEAGAAIELK